MRGTRALVIPSVAGALLLALGFSSPPAPVRVQRARYLMGTLATAVVEGADSAGAARVAAASLDEVARLERVMSLWQEDSELARLNRAAGTWFDCSEDLYAALDSALALARSTAGAFDPTVEPFNRVWDLRGRGRVPDVAELRAARACVGWTGLTLDPTRRTVRLAAPGMGVDLGGMGKGFALDRAGLRLAEAGIERALLNLGGEVLSFSKRDEPWQVAVAHPEDRLRQVARLAVANGAVSTSGQGERGVTVGGKRYGHVLDPRRGTPVSTRASVTVIAASATRADGLSTALLVMGRERAAALARSHPEIGVLWLEPDGRRLCAWRWNLTSVATEPGVLLWMN